MITSPPGHLEGGSLNETLYLGPVPCFAKSILVCTSGSSLQTDLPKDEAKVGGLGAGQLDGAQLILSVSNGPAFPKVVLLNYFKRFDFTLRLSKLPWLLIRCGGNKSIISREKEKRGK